MPVFEVTIKRTIVVDAYTGYEAVGRALEQPIIDLTEDDVAYVSERVPQPAYLTAALVAEAWREARDPDGNGMGYPEIEKEARS